MSEPLIHRSRPRRASCRRNRIAIAERRVAAGHISATSSAANIERPVAHALATRAVGVCRTSVADLLSCTFRWTRRRIPPRTACRSNRRSRRNSRRDCRASAVHAGWGDAIAGAVASTIAAVLGTTRARHVDVAGGSSSGELWQPPVPLRTRVSPQVAVTGRRFGSRGAPPDAVGVHVPGVAVQV